MKFLNRFPSWDQIIKSALNAISRFPFAFISALMGTTAAVNLIAHDKPIPESILEKLLLVACLGLPLFIAIVIFGESRRWKASLINTVQLIGALLLVAYYFTLPASITHNGHSLICFALLFIGLHFLIAWLPHTGKNETPGFWAFNISLSLRFLTSALFSAVLYVGLAIALAATDHLFGFDIDEIRYFQIWVIIVGIFNTWLFLAGIPSDLKDLTKFNNYPKGLRVFTQYILLPLLALYFLILFAYGAKILVTFNWPKGLVSQLVLWYSVVGLLSILLLHPLKSRADSRWITTFSKLLSLSLVPFVVMLFLAIFRRVAEYGITEPRYFVIAMATGLSVVVLYFLFSKSKDIRIIPIVLSVLAFVSALGPWGASSVSEQSQLSRLKTFMNEYEVSPDGPLFEASDETSLDARKEMSSIINYLNEWHGIESLSEIVKIDTLESLDSLSTQDRCMVLARQMGFVYVAQWAVPMSRTRFNIRAEHGDVVTVTGYDYYLRYEPLKDTISIRVFPLSKHSFITDYDADQSVLKAYMDNENSTGSDTMSIELTDLLPELLASESPENIDPSLLTFLFDSPEYNARVLIHSINGTRHSDSLEITNINTTFLIKLNE